jgi:hypothetical protein
MGIDVHADHIAAPLPRNRWRLPSPRGRTQKQILAWCRALPFSLLLARNAELDQGWSWAILDFFGRMRRGGAS